VDFKIPGFLAEQSAEKIHAEMLKELPPDIEKSAGGYPWDLTRPTAVITAEMSQMTLPRVMMQIWPQFATGEFLDYHAETRRMQRREAQCAKGKLIINGVVGLKIPRQTMFSTVNKNGVEGIRFISTTEMFMESDTAEIDIEALEAGISGNVEKDTIAIVISGGLTGISLITNPEATYGGYEEESDDELRKRIVEFDMNTQGSYIGNLSDYRRWALSVPAVGDAQPISPQDDSGIVTIFLTDLNGSPASPELCQAVYDYIMGPNNPLKQRLAPVNANLIVVPPAIDEISIYAIVELNGLKLLEEIKEEFHSEINKYYLEAAEDREVKYSRVFSILSGITGVNDCRDILINGNIKNIPLANKNIPVSSLSKIELIEGVV
jgi:Uncharacterized homolog of phage Mu protein gp47